MSRAKGTAEAIQRAVNLLESDIDGRGADQAVILLKSLINDLSKGRYPGGILPEDECNEVLRLRRQGFTLMEIADIYGISAPTVHRICSHNYRRKK